MLRVEAATQGDMQMNAFMREFLVAAREAPSIFFAPLTGAIKGIREALYTTRTDDHTKIDKPERDSGNKSHHDS